MAFYLGGLERDAGIFFWDFFEHKNTQTELRNSVRSEQTMLKPVTNPGKGTAGETAHSFLSFKLNQIKPRSLFQHDKRNQRSWWGRPCDR